MEVEFKSGNYTKKKDIEQVHACMGFKGLEYGDIRLYSLLAVNNIFGGGMSSRLFQKIREKKGLVYSIYSYPSSYKHAGLFTIYAGMNPENLGEVIKIVKDETKLLVKRGMTQDELKKSKEQLKGSYILGLESTSSRMNSIGKSELSLGRIDTPDEVMKKIEAISMESINEVIEEVFDLSHLGISVVGDIREDFSLKPNNAK
jgi:predicted Zn-dependent peptidase